MWGVWGSYTGLWARLPSFYFLMDTYLNIFVSTMCCCYDIGVQCGIIQGGSSVSLYSDSIMFVKSVSDQTLLTLGAGLMSETLHAAIGYEHCTFPNLELFHMYKYISIIWRRVEADPQLQFSIYVPSFYKMAHSNNNLKHARKNALKLKAGIWFCQVLKKHR